MPFTKGVMTPLSVNAHETSHVTLFYPVLPAVEWGADRTPDFRMHITLYAKLICKLSLSTWEQSKAGRVEEVAEMVPWVYGHKAVN